MMRGSRSRGRNSVVVLRRRRWDVAVEERTGRGRVDVVVAVILNE